MIVGKIQGAKINLENATPVMEEKCFLQVKQ